MSEAPIKSIPAVSAPLMIVASAKSWKGSCR